MDLTQYIRDVPDFPSSGILFRDITPLLQHPDAFRCAVDEMAAMFDNADFNAIAGVESRGFLFAAPIAYALGVPLVPVRKQGKLPFTTSSVSYSLEYGTDALEIHVDAIGEENRVLIIDDLIATGGTLAATIQLLEQAGAEVAGVGTLIELSDLDGRSALRGHRVESVLTY